MRCISCGLPLSPARTMTSCPRCGTRIVSEKKSSSSPRQGSLIQGEAWQPLTEQAVGAASGTEWGGFPSFAPPEMVRGPMRRPGEAGVENDHMPTSNGPGTGFPFAGAHASGPSQEGFGSLKAQPVEKVEDDSFQPAGRHVPELDPMWLSGSASGSADAGGSGSHVQELQERGPGVAGQGMRTDEQLKGFPQGAPALLPPAARSQDHSSGASAQRSWQPRATIAEGIDRRFAPSVQAVGMKDGNARSSPFAVAGGAKVPLKSPRRGNNNLGFLVAGLCVIAGGLMLFFIYFMALGAPDNSNGTSAVKTGIASNVSPTRTSVPAASAMATPFPGQRYIDHAQLSSRIDPASHEPISLTTTFKANQKMYVTFQVHPGGQDGAVCLLWYANNRLFIPSYALQVFPNEQTAYSYANYIGTGSGYVELYWASTTRCSDKVLAQRVYFTVTA